MQSQCRLKLAIGGGIGLFLALIALKNAGVIVDNPATLVGLGDLKQLDGSFGFIWLLDGGCTASL